MVRKLVTLKIFHRLKGTLFLLNIFFLLSFRDTRTYLPLAHDFWMARGIADSSDGGSEATGSYGSAGGQFLQRVTVERPG